MFDTNSVNIVGRLTRDPEVAYANQTALAKFSIANNSGKKDDPNSTNFFDVVVWGKPAEAIKNYVSKGSQVVVSGSLKQNRFQDKQGQNRSKVEIIAKSVQFVGGRKDAGQQQFPQQQNQQPPQNWQQPQMNQDLNWPQQQEPAF